MAETVKRPDYTAVILSPSGEDFGPIHIADARDDLEAGSFAMDRGAPQIAASGLDRATIQISKDGKGIRSIPVESHK